MDGTFTAEQTQTNKHDLGPGSATEGVYVQKEAETKSLVFFPTRILCNIMMPLGENVLSSAGLSCHHFLSAGLDGGANKGTAGR